MVCLVVLPKNIGFLGGAMMLLHHVDWSSTHGHVCKTWVQFILRLVFKSGTSKPDAWLNVLCLVQAAPSVGQLSN
jgi:hypothetical protein